MGHIRDIRLRASEIKFLVTADIASSIRIWARTFLEPDPHGAGPHRDEYQTTSVYFDTAGYDVFHRRGSFGRSRYRIRRYGEADSAFLERKMRGAIVLAKRRTATSIATLDRLANADVDPAWPGYWFHRRVIARRLRPVCQVSYHRMARSFVVDGAIARLTLDSELHARPLNDVTIPSARRRIDHEQPLDPRAEVRWHGALTLPVARRALCAESANRIEISARPRITCE